ncbi:MAG: single-stranded DNA-binding protein [Acholeplasmataceae bacterium]|jgi:single-strand DNA-binding protein|nr:single-stranded DNA-binding protein [Acholeplasmataceae bacterium]
MLNQVLLIGRLTADPLVRELESGKKVCDINLAVQRSFKNQDGLYETDFIPITLWQGLAETLSQFCQKGTLIAVRGRVQVRTSFIHDKSIPTLEIIGERITYLSAGKKELETE